MQFTDTINQVKAFTLGVNFQQALLVTGGAA
jgi:rRNA processing protein Krr1/Pno1